MIIMPLAMLDPSIGEANDDPLESQYDLDPVWRSTLFDRIETLPMPMQIELASTELSLSQVESLVPGQTLELPIDPAGLKVIAEHGTLLLNGALEIEDGNLNLRVLEAAG